MLQTFEVANIRCGGCASTIRTALDDAGFNNVKVDLLSEPRKVSADIHDDKELERFKKVLRDHGYPLVDEAIGLLDSATLKAKSFVSCAVGKFSTEEEKK
ncbi:MAG: cation transporter [Campylobacterales bacterium]|nr:cation transporter [Campylobacterales bacterium]